MLQPKNHGNQIAFIGNGCAGAKTSKTWNLSMKSAVEIKRERWIFKDY
jgi:hypothetical protein